MLSQVTHSPSHTFTFSHFHLFFPPSRLPALPLKLAEELMPRTNRAAVVSRAVDFYRCGFECRFRERHFHPALRAIRRRGRLFRWCRFRRRFSGRGGFWLYVLVLAASRAAIPCFAIDFHRHRMRFVGFGHQRHFALRTLCRHWLYVLRRCGQSRVCKCDH